MKNNKFINKAILKNYYNIIEMDDGVQLRSGDEDIFFLECEKPHETAKIIGLMDGDNSIVDISKKSNLNDISTVENIAEELGNAGMLTAQNSTDDMTKYFSHFMGCDFKGKISLQGTTVSLIGHDNLVKVISECLNEQCAKINRASSVSEISGELIVCAVETPDLSLMRKVNHHAIDFALPTLFIDLSHGQHATVGPFYIPDDGPCYHCFRRRLLENSVSFDEQKAFDDAQLESEKIFYGYGCLPAFRYIVAGMAVLEVSAFLVGHQPLRTLRGAVTIDFPNLRAWREPLWKVPSCEACQSINNK